ncbi:MAG: alginate export family protein [Deltaproteobacteria bacterium]
MKRILLSVFAVAITAVWVAPVSAADVTLGGHYRLRGEYTNNADFNKSINDHSDSWGQRVRLTANAKATDDTSVKITLQDTRTWGSTQATAGGPGLTDTGNTLDFHESYMNVENVFDTGVAFRAGRQELVYGDERLIGAFGWSNNGRSFDALKAVYKNDIVNIDLFTSKIIEKSPTNNDTNFSGIYATIKAIPDNVIDVYFLHLRDSNSATGVSPFGFGATIGNTTLTSDGATYLSDPAKLNTFGVRVKGAVSGLDYTVELPVQRGTITTNTREYDIKAYAFAAKLGYNLPTPIKARVGVEYDYASGDKDAGTTATPDTDLQTFSNLFPTNHDKLGLMDTQAWRNVKAWNLNATLEPTDKLKLLVSFWDFSLAQKNDAWYSAAQWNNNTNTGATLVRRANSSNGSKDLGNEIDLVASYKYNSAVSAEVGYGRYFVGKFAENNTANSNDVEDMDWAYLMLTTNF